MAAQGDFSRRIELELRGDFLLLRRAVNESLDALAQTFGAISATTSASKAGDLTRRAQGRFGKEIPRRSGESAEAICAQSASLQEIAPAIREFEQSNQQNSALVEEMSSASASFSDQSTQLPGGVARFAL